jgi:hypothetical protein
VEGDLKAAKHRKETLESMDPETRRATLVISAEVKTFILMRIRGKNHCQVDPFRNSKGNKLLTLTTP